MHVFYRISDKGNPKEKLPNADKFSCLVNAIAEFGRDSLYVIADNCNPETVSFIRAEGLPFEETSLGNSASFVYMAEKIIEERNPDEVVYLLEDDYIHLDGSERALIEGLDIADYVTLYDHPDKYKTENEGGSPYNDKKLRKTRVYATETSHWRETDSTTMTFACKVSTLGEDIEIWKKYCRDRNPDDFHAFMEITPTSITDILSFFLRLRKREFKILLTKFFVHRPARLLVSALPAKATHAETRWLSPVIDWKRN